MSKSKNIQQRGRRSWRLRYTNADGIRQAETIKGSFEDAVRELAIRRGEIAKGLPVSSRPNTVLFEQLAADVLTDYDVNWYTSRDDADARFRLHILPVFGKRKAAQITTAMLKRYIVMRQAGQAKTGTINRELELIRHTFRLAIQGRTLMVMPHVPHLREDNVRSGFFTRQEVERLCSFLKEPLASLVMFGFLTGWRLEECRGLLWRNVDFDKGEIRLDVGTTKSGEGRVFPMSAELRSILMKALSETQKTPVAATSDKGMPSHRVTAIAPRVFAVVGEFRKTWKTACHKAGLPCIVKPIIMRGKPLLDKNGKPRVKVIKALRTFHDLRRSFAREMDRMGVRQSAIMKLGGWETDSVFRRYNIVSESDLRDAIEKVDAREIGPTRGPTAPKTGSKRRET